MKRNRTPGEDLQLSVGMMPGGERSETGSWPQILRAKSVEHQQQLRITSYAGGMEEETTPVISWPYVPAAIAGSTPQQVTTGIGLQVEL